MGTHAEAAWAAQAVLAGHRATGGTERWRRDDTEEADMMWCITIPDINWDAVFLVLAYLAGVATPIVVMYLISFVSTMEHHR
jgi:hypothetical protein